MPRFRLRWPEDYSKDLRTLPKPTLARLMLGVFLAVGATFLNSDLMNRLRFPLWWTIAQAGVMGAFGATFVAAGRSRKAMVIGLTVLAGIIIGMGVVPPKLPANHLLSGPGLLPVRQRLREDGILILGAAAMGYTIFLRTIGGEVARHVRTRAELTLAEQVQ